MSEIQKHIESCRSEDPLAQTMEACGNESDIQAALQPLLRETMQGYVPVATTAPTAPIAELPGVLISIIRRVATKPLAILGDRPAKQSLLGTLLDTWNAIRQRLAGNPSAGIPDRRADMSGHSLPTALALLNDRKITNGGAENDGIADGESLMHILSGDYNAITKLGDDNSDYTMTLQPATLLGYFPNCKKFVYGCSRALVDFDYNTTNIEEMEFPNLTYYKHPNTTARHNFCMVRGKMERVNFPELTYYGARDNGYGNGLVCDLPNCKEFKAQKLATWWAQDSRYPAIYNCPNLEVVDFRSLPAPVLHCTQSGITAFDNCPNLIDINFKEYTASRDMSGWNPTNVLADADKTATFLLNFRDHIALRLTDNGSGLTLTLSQAVRNAIHAAESTYGIENIIITQKGWTISPAPN